MRDFARLHVFSHASKKRFWCFLPFSGDFQKPSMSIGKFFTY
ncbi:hypothetical protein BIFCAT_00036 [Bifidobacterium catenulatum DSM 16992 = JCM 1194 = LMG 11043]|uniref:Uncharacterized protein n=1 Tax=Bifidobacterium catenulatum DSM 16992 = JCM 1194 = LMG 11043 TaxID=566552 RepID=B6XSH9_9BIFI|nr:hypothetical protein BIFCAT_00036 [Bifidobacterium catenulatum DSM 16992 = JCM 1194 = LMG 11043]